MKKYFLIFFLILFLAGCSKNSRISGNTVLDEKNTDRVITIEKLEIFYFHGNNRCYSCITLGDYAEETINTYFSEEIKNGKIIFKQINGELPENKDLIIKYGVNNPSLWLGTYKKNGEFSAEQNINVWYKLSNKKDFMTYLKKIIEKKLAEN